MGLDLEEFVMRTTYRSIVYLLFSLASLAAPRPANFINAPLAFEPNLGQADPAVQLVSRGDGYALYFKAGEVVLNNLRMTLVGANADSRPAGLARRTGVVSYFIGNDPKKWRTGIPTFGKVNYAGIYPGVDLVFYGNQRQLEYDFVVAPGADPSHIAWRIDGAKIDAQGNLVLDARTMFKKPVVYQKDGDDKVPVDGSFTIAGNRVGFRLGRYDHSKELIIDPVLTFVSYIDGSGSDSIGAVTSSLTGAVSQGLAIDSAGSIYVTGTTQSLDFPTQNPFQPAPSKSAPSVFVSKFSPDGSSLVYSTYLAGSSWDLGYSIAVDSNGSAYVTGESQSVDFPITPGAYQKICYPVPTNTPPIKSGCGSEQASAFLTKLDPTGTSLIYSTFLGGFGGAFATAVAVDAVGNAYIAGNESTVCNPKDYAFPACFPTTAGAVIGGTAPIGAAPLYTFVAVFDPTGSQLLYSTLFGDLNGTVSNSGGAGVTFATGIVLDANGYIDLTGYTEAGRLPTTPGVVQPTSPLSTANPLALNSFRGYVAKFYPLSVGPALVWATYLGGQYSTRHDFASGIAVDGGGNVYVAGNTNAADYPTTPGAYQTQCGGGDPTGQCHANFVTKRSTILWSTYVGGAIPNGADAVSESGPILLDGNGNVYIVGIAPNAFPMVDPVEPYNWNGGNPQLLVAELDPTGSNLLFSTLIGSGGLDTMDPAGLSLDASGNIYLAGNTGGPDLITTPGAFMTAPKNSVVGPGKGFVARIAAQGTANVTLKSSQAGPTLTLTAKVSPPWQYASMPTGQVVFFNGDSAFAVVNLDATGTATYSTSTAPPGTYTITAQYSGDSTYPAVSTTITATLNPLP